MTVLAFHDVDVVLGREKVLSGVTLDVARGERIALIGPSGSGKSTLLRASVGLVPIASGTVSAFGTPLAGRGLTEARRRIGMIFQAFHLYGMKTVAENVALAPREIGGLARDAARAKAEAILARVGCTALADRYPSELSGGQQQRVAIARALAMDPEILLLDEPTASLDPELVRSALDLLLDVAGTGTAAGPMTVLCATHEVGFARRLANRVIFLDGGRIFADGPIAQIDAPPTERLRDFLAAAQPL